MAIVTTNSGESGAEGLDDLHKLLAAIFEDSSAAVRWLDTPVPALGGRRPREVIDRGDIESVIGLLAGLRSGAFG